MFWSAAVAVLLSTPIFTTSFTHSKVSISATMKGATILPILSQLNANMKVILASGSPRRKELIGQLGLTDVSVLVSTFAEDFDKSLFACPQDYCLATASKKVEEVALKFNGHEQKTLVIGADTIIEIDGKVLEKPVDAADSKRMLSLMRNRDHFVHTAVIAYSNTKTLQAGSPDALFLCEQSQQPVMKNIFSFVESTKVTFTDLSDSDIDAYVALGEGNDKAGSYAIQGTGGLFVKGIEGCYYNVVGLPIHSLSNRLASSFDC